MTHHLIDPAHSASQIRRRLWTLLIQSFTAVVLLTILLLVVLSVLVINAQSPRVFFFVPSIAYALEGFYLGQGNWTGVERLSGDAGTLRFNNRGPDWERDAVLLDEKGNVLVDYSGSNSSVGKPYITRREDLRFPLRVKGNQVGLLIMRGRPSEPSFEQSETALLWRTLSSLLFPIGFIAFFTGLMTVVIGLMLMRRVVSPLVDVIAAAQLVAAGDLSTRVQVKGRGDLRDLSESFNRMADSLERNDLDRRALLADVAHELRTPLTILRGRLEGIIDNVYPADEEHIAPVLEETYMLERVIDDLHLLSLAEARQLHFDLARVDLGESARRAVDLFEMAASEKNITLKVKVEDDLPTVSADGQRVEQVISNLLNNAIQYIPDKGEVRVDVRRSAHGVAVSVSDNGRGVPDDDLPKLFDRFWRAEKSRARSSGGAGLGLAIARQLIEAQGGTITASNVPGGGLKITFELKSNAL